MIKLTKPEIDTLILKYLTDHSFKYTAYVFRTECTQNIPNIRSDISLDKLLTMGIKYLYGVEHFRDGKVETCGVLYSIGCEHLC